MQSLSNYQWHFFFTELEQKISQCEWKHETPNSQSNLEKENGAGGIRLHDFGLYYKVTVIKIVQYCHKTETDGEIYRVHGLEESTLSKWPYYPTQSTDSMQSLSSYQQYFSQN